MLDIANAFMVLAIQKIIKLGRVKPEQINGKWRIEIKKETIKDEGLAAYTTIDSRNQVVIYIPSNLKEKDMRLTIFLLAHESVHVAQVCCGDLVPQAGSMTWKGKQYFSLPADDPQYIAQPWEEEAFRLQNTIQDYMVEKLGEGGLHLSMPR